MNRQLESLFDLPPVESFAQETKDVQPLPEASDDTSLLQRVEQALPQVRGLRTGENEVDTIADEALKTFQEIKDLAMNVEPKYTSELLTVAATLLQTALNARQGKNEAKLKAIRLQLQAHKAQQEQSNAGAATTVTQGKIVGDRNQIIASMKKSPTTD